MKGKKLRAEIFKAIQECWPVHVSGICRYIGIDENASNISKIRYHINLLQKEHKIYTKKLDRALVCWPVEIEKLRVMHQFMNDY
ncbi:MAG: hypothetical protein ACOCZ6_00960 [Nanoarchaeota archaeon]